MNVRQESRLSVDTNILWIILKTSVCKNDLHFNNLQFSNMLTLIHRINTAFLFAILTEVATNKCLNTTEIYGHRTFCGLLNHVRVQGVILGWFEYTWASLNLFLLLTFPLSIVSILLCIPSYVGSLTLLPMTCLTCLGVWDWGYPVPINTVEPSYRGHPSDQGKCE